MATSSKLAAQWFNPSDVSTVLFVLGGDIVQKAFSQGTGKAYVPVCFSFGCAAYAFIGLVRIIGDGRLLSPPDYACKVLNLNSGYLRDSKSFVIGRLLRDMEAIEARRAVDENEDDDYALRISVFSASWNGNGMTNFSWSYIHLIGFTVTLLQFGLALVPLFINQSWNVLLITAVGTALVQWIGILPQWTAEKLPNRQRSSQKYALTSGNGSRDIMVIIGYGRCLDLESLATMPSSRISRPWEKFFWLSDPKHDERHQPLVSRRNTMLRSAKRCRVWPLQGLPLGFIITHISFMWISVLWLLLLINVSASASSPETWCLLAVGGLGMFQNAWLAATEVPTKLRNLPLERIDRIRSYKVMDAIMDFHITYKLGLPLRDEFFPGNLKPDEVAWWNGDYSVYDKNRREHLTRGRSRRENPQNFPPFVYEGAAWEELEEAVNATPAEDALEQGGQGESIGRHTEKQSGTRSATGHQIRLSSQGRVNVERGSPSTPQG